MSRSVVLQRCRLAVLAALLISCFLGAPAQPVQAVDLPGSIFLPLITAADQNLSASDGNEGAAYVLTNQASANAVAIYHRSADGSLEAVGSVPTGGLGTGSALGSQGSVVLSDDGRWLLAVNAGSSDVSVFAVQPRGLALTDRAASGGTLPTSVTIYKDLVYVLNAGGSGSISGFRLSNDGRLLPIAASTRPLSSSGTAPAQVSFSPDGATLIVTERATNLLLAYAVDAAGLASGPQVYASSGATPFGFAFTQQGTLVVSEAFGGMPNASAVSSYAVSGAEVQVISPSVSTGETAACWIAVSKNGKFAYSTNAGSGSVSAYEVHPDGSLALIDGRAGVTGDGTQPIDAMVSHNGQYLYVLLGRTGSIAIFAVQSDGRLLSMGTIAGLPAGAAGLAAW